MIHEQMTSPNHDLLVSDFPLRLSARMANIHVQQKYVHSLRRVDVETM